MDLASILFLVPINIPDFECTLTDVEFRDWKAAGITKMHEIYVGGTLKSFQQLQEEYQLHQMHFYPLPTDKKLPNLSSIL